jgi:hypothetical protein
MHANVPEYWEEGNIIQSSHLNMLKNALIVRWDEVFASRLFGCFFVGCDMMS